MSTVFLKAFKYTKQGGMFSLVASSRLFRSELFLRAIKHNEKNLQLGLNHNKAIMSINTSYDLRQIEDQLAIELLKNSRELMNEYSFQVKTLKLEYSETLFSSLGDFDFFGLVNLEINCFSADSFENQENLHKLLTLLSYPSILKLECPLSLFEKFKSVNVKHLDLRIQHKGALYFDFNFDFDFDLSSFPNLESLIIRECGRLSFKNSSPHLTSLSSISYPIGVLDIDFNQFPKLEKLELETNERINFFNESGQLKSILSPNNEIVVGSIENCLFEGLEEIRSGPVNRYYHHSNSFFQMVNKAKNLIRLELGDMDYSSIEHLEHLEILRVVDICEDFSFVEKFPNLKCLWLWIRSSFDPKELIFPKTVEELFIGGISDGEFNISGFQENCCDDMILEFISASDFKGFVIENDNFFRKSLTIINPNKAPIEMKNLSEGKTFHEKKEH